MINVQVFKKYVIGAFVGGILYLGFYFLCEIMTFIFFVGEGEPNLLLEKFFSSRCFYTHPFSWALFIASILAGMGIHFLILEKVFKKEKVNTKY